MFFDDDFQQRIRTVLMLLNALQQAGQRPWGVTRKLLDGNAVGAGATGVLLHALPSVPKIFLGQRQGRERHGAPPDVDRVPQGCGDGSDLFVTRARRVASAITMVLTGDVRQIVFQSPSPSGARPPLVTDDVGTITLPANPFQSPSVVGAALHKR